MADRINLEVVTPERKILEAPVDEVVLPGSAGYLGVRPGHTPLLTSLGIGFLSYTQGGRVHRLAVADGFAEVLGDRVIVLSETAERPEDIDLERAEASRDRARKTLAERLNQEDGEFRRAETRLQRATIRISLARQGRPE